MVSTINLGKADVYPAYSGKANAAVHIAKQMGVDMKDTAFLCDDDNDIDLAKVVGKAYMPTVAAVRFPSLPRRDACCTCRRIQESCGKEGGGGSLAWCRTSTPISPP